MMVCSGKTDIKSLSYEELTEFITGIGEKAFRAKQIYEWMHVKCASGFEEMTDLSISLRNQLAEKCCFCHLEIEKELISSIDGTRKFLFRLYDGNIIESVMMRYEHGISVCISSQVGCRMGCRFCASTIDGLERNLTPAEMLEQIYRIQKHTGERVSHVVIMGSGEPLDNYENFIRFLRLITDEKGLNISRRNITASTCGLIEGIRRLADENTGITLAVSLHAPNDEKRRQIMPVAYRYSIPEILDACRYFFEKTGRRLTFEYALIEGVNDSVGDAAELSRIASGVHAHINLIPVNPVRERDYRQSTARAVAAFREKLEKNGINVTIRREMGRDISGACGQLRRSYVKE